MIAAMADGSNDAGSGGRRKGAKRGRRTGPQVEGGAIRAAADFSTLPLDQLPAGLPPEVFTAPGILALADVLPVMIAFVSADLKLGFVNQPLAEWFEIPRRDLLGTSIADIIGEDRLAQREPMYRRALAGERLFFVSDFDHPARGSVALQSNFVPWADPDGTVRGFFIVQQDVTEQRSSERALRESEARFRRIANSAPALMWVTRIDRVRDFVNEAYAEFACGPGCDHEEARTLDWRGRIHPDDVDRIVAESITGEASLQPFALEGR